MKILHIKQRLQSQQTFGRHLRIAQATFRCVCVYHMKVITLGLLTAADGSRCLTRSVTRILPSSDGAVKGLQDVRRCLPQHGQQARAIFFGATFHSDRAAVVASGNHSAQALEHRSPVNHAHRHAAVGSPPALARGVKRDAATLPIKAYQPLPFRTGRRSAAVLPGDKISFAVITVSLDLFY